MGSWPYIGLAAWDLDWAIRPFAADWTIRPVRVSRYAWQRVGKAVRIHMSLAVFQSIGPLELLIVLGIVLIIFGPKRLPTLGRQLGAGMREFKDSISRKDDDDDDEDEDDDAKDQPAALAPPEDQAAPSSVSDGVTSEPR